MNQLIIIGNGFDRAHGLKTSYEDFVLWYLNKISSNYSHSTFDDKIDLAWIHRHYKPVRAMSSIDEFSKAFANLSSGIRYNSFFETIKDDARIKGWVDIESLYFEELISYIEHRIAAKQRKLYPSDIEAIKELNNSLDLIKHYLQMYLTEIDKQEIKYNMDIVTHFNDTIKLTKIGDITESVNILNFNYTSTARKYFNSSWIESKGYNYVINDIHGRLNDEKNPMIFGYGDETADIHQAIENFNENELTRNIKSFHYLLSSNYQDLFDFIESGEFKVSIMGHSCGLSDRVLLSNIFQHKNLNEIQLHYHKIDKNKNDFFKRTQDISRHFDSNSKHIMRYKIVPFEKCSPLTRPKQ